MDITISKSKKKDKKFDVKINNKTISFGSAMHSDFTKHKDTERKQRYIKRHKANENWNKSGIQTAGCWSKNLLWNKDTLKDSLQDINKRFNVNAKII